MIVATLGAPALEVAIGDPTGQIHPGEPEEIETRVA